MLVRRGHLSFNLSVNLALSVVDFKQTFRDRHYFTMAKGNLLALFLIS